MYRSPFAAFAVLPLLLVTTTGCWQEIRYQPELDSVTPTARQASNSVDSPPARQSPQLEPAAEEPARQESADEPSASEQPTAERTVEVASATKRALEVPDPMWEDLESETKATATPAPAAELDWLDDPAEDEAEAPVEKTTGAPLAAAWQLGSKWSLAVGIYGKGFGRDRYGSVLDKAEAAAKELNINAPAVPSSSGNTLAEALESLREVQGPFLVRSVGRNQSLQHEALCELAISTHALLLDYSPSGQDIDATVYSLRKLARSAQLPERLWEGVVEALERRAEFQAVKAAVLKLHRATEEHLQGR